MNASMSDMPSDFWAGWIAVITILSLAGLAWLIFSIYFSPADEQEDDGGPVWDKNLREGSHPAPLWWFWMILASLVFSVIYLMLYPGLGSYQGALKWSQGGNLEASIVRYGNEFGNIRRLINDANLATLQEDPGMMRSAQRIFNRSCAVCHGYEAQGQAAHFPSLIDNDWQWGGSAAQIEQSIRFGRNAAMVPWGQVLGEQGIEDVALYVEALGTANADGHPGQAQYNQFCVACHGVDGTGNQTLGAPNLVDDIWLYGDDETAIRQSIAQGRTGQMPAFGDRLDDTQIRLLVALLAGPQSAD
jgi:cytochrome c oxidase cbb3-type subunit 3